VFPIWRRRGWHNLKRSEARTGGRPNTTSRFSLAEGNASYIAVVDKDRNMVSFEPSRHSAFGTGSLRGTRVSSSTAAATTTH
jgi:gamma-glutamyltranspeptidase